MASGDWEFGIGEWRLAWQLLIVVQMKPKGSESRRPKFRGRLSVLHRSPKCCSTGCPSAQGLKDRHLYQPLIWSLDEYKAKQQHAAAHALKMTTLNECDDNVNDIAIVEPQPAIEDCSITDEDSICSTVYDSPNGTRYWTPIVRDEFKPIVGSVFVKWDDVVFMYDRYMMCNKAGKPHGVVFDSLDKSLIRRTNFEVTDCKARIKVKYIKDTSSFQLYEHIENHNHGLINSDNLDLSKKKRRLNFSDKEYIAKCRLANVGPSKAHKLQVALKGGHHMVRGTKIDFKNFGRDVSMFINKGDAQMFVNRMTERSEQSINFTFNCHCIDYEVRGLFWADDVSKKNYKVFGDVLAFDATYQTNMQRFNQRLLEHSTTTTTPQFRTTMNIERNANEIYTRTILKEVQKEIYKSTTLCYISNRNIVNGLHTYCVTYQDNRCNIINEFTVNFDLKDDSVSCTCMGFTRIGYLCGHVICVFRNYKIENIPIQYVHNRWRRDVLPRSVFSMSNRYCVDQSESSTTRNRIVDNIQQTTDRISNDPDRLALLDKEFEAIKEKIFQEIPYSQIN
ncbi:hypothetical protein E3N88_38629 [Mikania micrantha]|uniref:SWIM-type domain-containing protein n=1 Tax=Mikania micrantha TaxID=192012 RepID=A0A5N6LX27_9ASTR|nr:hypothetical protein E3N88_38629 [Mikania micrantha]